MNEVIVRDVIVPAGSPQLTFDAAWDLELTFDFGYAQMTTDGGETYTSLQCTDTVDDTDPALGNVGPGFGQGFNGENDPPVFAPQTCDLTPYAGQTVGLAFRIFNDGGVHFTGFWVDNVAIDGTVISDGSTDGSPPRSTTRSRLRAIRSSSSPTTILVIRRRTCSASHRLQLPRGAGR